MTLASVFENATAGGIVAVAVIILSLIEIVPIKISPLNWLGKRLNGEALKRIKDLESKLDEHIAQSYRTKILKFQDDIVDGKSKTKEQWKEVVNAISNYESYCEVNKIKNGLCAQASSFISKEYQRHLKLKDFAMDAVSEASEEEKVC